MKHLLALTLALLLTLLPLAHAEEPAVDLFTPDGCLKAWEDCLDVSLAAQLAEQTDRAEDIVRVMLTLTPAAELTDPSVPCVGYSNEKKSMVLYFGGSADSASPAEYIVCDCTNETLVRVFALFLEMVCSDLSGLYTWTKTAPADDGYMFGPYYIKYTAGTTYTLLIMKA